MKLPNCYIFSASLLSIICSTSISALDFDDSTAPKVEPVVTSMPSNIHIDIDNSFEDIINHQFDLRMKEMQEKFKKDIFDSIAPVGHVLVTTNSNNPKSYGYAGTWVLVDSDVSLVSTKDPSQLNNVIGENDKVVPVPYHTHTGIAEGVELSKTFFTNWDGTHKHTGLTDFAGLHSHQYQRVTAVNSNGSYPLDGNEYYTDVRTYNTAPSGNHRHSFTTNSSGNHRHSVLVDFGKHTHNIVIAPAGSVNATLNVVGKHLTVFIWQRVA